MSERWLTNKVTPTTAQADSLEKVSRPGAREGSPSRSQWAP